MHRDSAHVQTRGAWCLQVLLEHPGVTKMYEYEDGHILDLAAANGDIKMVKLLLHHNMTVGPASLAHAAHFNHSEVVEVRTRQLQPR